MAYIVISGSSAYLCELADFTDHSASVDISELEAGSFSNFFSSCFNPSAQLLLNGIWLIFGCPITK